MRKRGTITSNYLTASETAALVRSGSLSMVEVVKDHIARHGQRDPDVQAWAFFSEEHALREAERLDEITVDKRGPLHGLVLGLKDMMQTSDLPTQHGSRLYKDHRPGVDAGVVTLCRQAGALILGKTHTTEFAFTTVGNNITSNPFDTSRTPGGSSSGSGAAVSDWQCHMALGTQTIGSMMRPASFNGVFGYKATWGAVTREGLKTSSLTLDTIGMFARSVQDLQLLSSALRIADDDPTISLKPIADCHFAFAATDQWSSLGTAAPSPETERAWALAQDLLRKAGAKVTILDLPSEFNGISRGLNLVVLNHEAKTCFLPEYLIDEADREAGQSRVGTDALDVVEGKTSPAPTHAEYLQALDKLASLRAKIDDIAGGYDAIITPSTTGEAPVGKKWTGDSRFCGMWTALHVPTVNVPGFASEAGMPLGLTLVAPRFHDQRLLSVASQVAKVWVGTDEAKLRKIPCPDGAHHIVA